MNLKDTIITKNIYEFYDWFKLVDTDLQEKMLGLFDKDDPRNKIIEREIRKKKLKKIGGT